VECFNTFGETEGLLRALRRKHRDHSRRGRRVGWATKQNSGMDRGGTEIKNFCESASKSLAIFEIEFFRACEPRHRPIRKIIRNGWHFRNGAAGGGPGRLISHLAAPLKHADGKST
jgi:hypothetical protein